MTRIGIEAPETVNCATNRAFPNQLGYQSFEDAVEGAYLVPRVSAMEKTTHIEEHTRLKGF